MPSLKPALACLAVVLLAAVPAQGLGINCRGSARCTLNGDRNMYEAQTLTQFINGIDENRWYDNGEHIACTPAKICAFLQKTGGAPGKNIKGLAHLIPEHGCTVCGSVPYFYPSDNNVDDGELTYNFVSSPKCDNGLC